VSISVDDLLMRLCLDQVGDPEILSAPLRVGLVGGQAVAACQGRTFPASLVDRR